MLVFCIRFVCCCYGNGFETMSRRNGLPHALLGKYITNCILYAAFFFVFFLEVRGVMRALRHMNCGKPAVC